MSSMTTDAQLLLRKINPVSADPDDLDMGTFMDIVSFIYLPSAGFSVIPNPNLLLNRAIEHQFQTFNQTIQLGENLRSDLVCYLL